VAGYLTFKTAPHLVLGVATGASHSDVIAAFARRSRVVKGNASSYFSIEDLTSALSEIEISSREDALTLRYSVPANGDVFLPNHTIQHEGATLTPKSDLSALVASNWSHENTASAALVFLAASIEQLLMWEWQTASAYARECLRLSRNEAERDEALNVLAASFAMQGDTETALQALKKAVEGDWNLGLQVNLAIIATEEDPTLAVSHMAHMVSGARNIGERIQASRIAIQLWRSTEEEETGSDDDDDFTPLPRLFLDAMHLLLEAADLTEEDFYEIGTFLARVDAGALSESKAIERSKHSRTLSAEALRQRTIGIGEFLESLVSLAARDRDKSLSWMQQDVDTFVGYINSRLVDDENDSSYAESLAFSFLEQGLDCSNYQRVSMRFWLIIAIQEYFLEDNSEPSDKFVKWYSEAATAVEGNWLQITGAEFEVIKNIKEYAGNILGHLYDNALAAKSTDILGIANGVRERMTGFFNRLSADKDQIRNHATRTLAICNVDINTYNSVIPLVVDDELRAVMTGHLRVLQQASWILREYT